MFKTVKNMTFLWALGLTLVAPQASFAADDQGENPTQQASSPAMSHVTQTQSTLDDVASQDPIKNFATQAKAEADSTICPCIGCKCFTSGTQQLWNALNDVNPSPAALQILMSRYANHDHNFNRLTPTLQSWLTEQGYRTESDGSDSFTQMIVVIPMTPMGLPLGIFSNFEDSSSDEEDTQPTETQTPNYDSESGDDQSSDTDSHSDHYHTDSDNDL